MPVCHLFCVRVFTGSDGLLIESPAVSEDVPHRSELHCERSLGGSLKHYRRKAA
jgi:hypothetical protein